MTPRALTILAAALCATTLGTGSALAQTRPQTPAPRTNPLPPPPPAVGTVPAGQGQSQAPQVGIGAEYDLGGATMAGTRSSSTGPVGDPPVAAEAAISTTRSNIKPPSQAMAPEAGASPAPAPVAPR